MKIRISIAVGISALSMCSCRTDRLVSRQSTAAARRLDSIEECRIETLSYGWNDGQFWHIVATRATNATERVIIREHDERGPLFVELEDLHGKPLIAPVALVGPPVGLQGIVYCKDLNGDRRPDYVIPHGLGANGENAFLREVVVMKSLPGRKYAASKWWVRSIDIADIMRIVESGAPDPGAADSLVQDKSGE